MSVGGILDKVNCWLLIVNCCWIYTLHGNYYPIDCGPGLDKRKTVNPALVFMSPCLPALRSDSWYPCFCPWTWGKPTFNLTQFGQTPTSFYLRLLLLLGLQLHSAGGACVDLWRMEKSWLAWIGSADEHSSLPTCFISNVTVICVGWFTLEWLSIREVYSWIFDLLNKQLSTFSFINCSENLQFR